MTQPFVDHVPSDKAKEICHHSNWKVTRKKGFGFMNQHEPTLIGNPCMLHEPSNPLESHEHEEARNHENR